MQRTCKPGSVFGSHLSGTDIAARLKPPVRRLAEQAVAPESVLLRIEFTGWACCQVHRWALAPPFHPYRAKRGGLFLLHLSGGRPRPTLSVILLCEARTFLTGSPLRGCPARCRFIISVVGGNVKQAAFCGRGNPAPTGSGRWILRGSGLPSRGPSAGADPCGKAMSSRAQSRDLTAGPP